MELSDIEKCCCVVQVLEAFSPNPPVSCSGVVIHPQTGIVICAGLPFSRFVTDTEPLSAGVRFLRPHSFSEKLKILVTFSAERHFDNNQPALGQAFKPSGVNNTACNQEVTAELLLMVNCVEFKEAFQAIFKESDQWRFHSGEEDKELVRDAQFLSWFAVVKAKVVAGSSSHTGTMPWQSSSLLQKGCPVVACGSPFGSLCLDLFISTISRGIVSNLAGEDNAVILTDARCLPGTEGGGLFMVKSADSVRLIGLIVSPFGWKANEWIGLTLVCSIHSIFKSIIQCMNNQDPFADVWLHPRETGLHMSATAHEHLIKYPTVCHVDSGLFWGSGALVTSQLVVTCRHVVNGKSKVTLKFHHTERVRDIVGEVLFSTKSSSPYDLALVQLRDPVTDAVVPPMAQSFIPGESVVVVGYGGLGRSCGPSLTCGVLSKTISLEDRPVMLQTTCAVQAGTSGGAVVRRCSGELLGIVSSNTRDLAAKVTYPHLNFSIPVSVFQGLLQDFHQTKDVGVFRVLDTTEEEVKRVWRLQGVPSKL